MIDTKVLEKLARLDDATILRLLPDSERSFFEYGFQRGYNRALKDLWHPASEEPKKDMLVLTDTQSIMNKGNICWVTVKLTENGFIHNWSNYVKATKITRWLYIDDLFPKQEGGEQ